MSTDAPNSTPAPPDAESYRYDAFISYRHIEPDRTWAKWLHAALETYRIPPKLLGRPGVTPLLRRVFRDEEELPASADLSSQIDKALLQSRFLIVICSPGTPASRWIDAEIRRFRALGRDDRILALLIAGEPGSSFPKALCEMKRVEVDGSGRTVETLVPVEPLAADVRPGRTERRGHLRHVAKLRFLACMLGCHFDDLRQREQLRQARRMKVAAAILSLMVAGTSTLAVWAMYQRELAVRATHYAQRQRDLAVDALNTMVFDAHDMLADRAGTRQLQDALLQSALEKLAQVKQDDEFGGGAGDLSAAVAMHKRANLFMLAGRTDDAQKLLDKSLAALADAAAGGGTGVDRARADALHLSGLIRQRAGDTAGAKKLLTEALALREQVAQRQPAVPGVQADLGESQDRLGDLEALGGNARAARDWYEKSRVSREAWRTLDPRNPRAERELAVSYTSLGDAARVLGDIAAAVERFGEAQVIFEKLAAADRYNTTAQRNLAVAYNKRASVRQAIGDLPRARADYGKALDIMNGLAAGDRGNGDYQRELSVCLGNLAEVTLAMGDAPSAERDGARAVQIAADWAAADPLDARSQRRWADALQGMAAIRLSLSRVKEAGETYDQALAIRRKLVAADPTDADSRRELAILHDKRGDLAAARKDAPGAAAEYTEALKLREALAAADEASAQAQRDLTISYNRLGRVSDSAAAVTWYDKSVAVCRRLVALDASSPQAHGDLGVALHLLGSAYQAAARTRESLGAFIEAMGIFERLAAANPAEPAQRRFAAACGTVGNAHMGLGEKKQAASAYRKAADVARRMAQRLPDSLEWQVTAVTNLTRVADLLEPAEAVEHYTAALEIVKKLEAAGKLTPAQASWRPNLEEAVKRSRKSA